MALRRKQPGPRARADRRLQSEPAPAAHRPRARATFVEHLESRLLLAGTGLTGQYYDNADFTTLKLTRTDATLNFDWGTGIPATGVGADTFSVRWTGQIQAQYSEPCTFHVTANDGVRLWVNKRLIIDNWTSASSALALSGQIDLVAGEFYDLRLDYYDNTSAASVKLEWSSPHQARQVVPQAQLYPTSTPDDRGSIQQEIWTGIAGTSLSSLTSSANYPAKPSGREYLLSFESLQQDRADDYGERVRGYLVPAVSGNYTFAISGDDQTQLYLSPDSTSAGKLLIASADSATAFREFTKFASQQSAAITLVAGQKYYIEALHKEGAGTDHFSVAWKTPGSSQFAVIPGQVLAPYGTDLAVPAQGSILNTLAQQHPRVMTTPQRFNWVKTQIASAGQMQTWYNTLKSNADSYLTAALPTYTQDNRGTILGVSRSMVDHVSRLALVWQMTGDSRYAERAWDELNAAANFPDWHPAHFLDTAEMTHAFAIGYDWLYDYWTPDRRTILSDSIINKGLNQALPLYPSSSWTSSTSNNWNLVCNGGIIMGALAIAEVNPTLVESILAKAIPSVKAVMRHFTSDQGGWYEGPGYWDYSTSYNSRMLASLESVLGSDFGLGQTPGMSETGDFAVNMTSPARLSFNYYDSNAGVMKGPQLLWYARRFNRPTLAWYERTNGSASPMDLLWYDTRGSDPGSNVAPTDVLWRGDTSAYSPQDIVTMRTNWSDSNATYVGFKAGKVGDSHGNLDAGSFVLDALGQRWAYDLGGDDYALPGYFGSSRWTYYRMRAEGQNTLVINPGTAGGQTTNAITTMIRQQATADGSVAIADITPAYAGMTRVWRGMSMSRLDGSVIVQDEIQSPTAADVYWFMHVKLAASQIQISADGTSALLTSGNNRLWMKILPGSSGQFSVMDPVPLPTSPNPAGQNANAGFLKLAIHLQNVTTRTLAVMMVPLKAGQNPPGVLPTIQPLANWTAPVDAQQWLGDTDGYLPGDAVNVDAAWQSQITAATGLAASTFDTLTDNTVVPFTFNFTVPAGQQVIGARIDLGLRSTGGDSSTDRLFLDSTATALTYAALGWATPTTSPTSRTLDLSNYLACLQDGKLNLALSKNTAIDWASLNVEFGPTGLYQWSTLPAEADAYVRDGTYAANNYPTGGLSVKFDGTNYNREAFVRFDLSSLANVTGAFVRFVPVDTAAVPENVVSFVSDDSWTETGLTWNNRPTASTAISAWTVAANAPVWIDVTSLVQSELSGDRKLSLKLTSTITGADNWSTYASREDANPNLRPQLLITTLAAGAGTLLQIDGTAQDDSIRVVSDNNYLDVYVNNTGATPDFRRDLATLQQVQVNGLAGADTLWVDASGGNPVPAGGFAYDGGAGSDTLGIAGSAATMTPGQIDLGSSVVGFSSAEYGAFSVGSLTLAGNCTLTLGADDAISALTDVTVSGASTLDLNGHATAADAVLLADGSIVNGTLTGTVYTLQSGTITASLGGVATLTKKTTGKVVLTGNSTYTGATSVSEGILNIRSGTALGSGTAAVTIGADGATNRYGTLELEGPDFTLDKPLFTTGNGFGGVNATTGIPFSGNGCVRNLSGNHTLTGAVTMTGGGGASNYQSDAGLLTFTGNITPNTTGRELNLQGAGNGAITGIIANGSTVALPVKKAGTGKWALSGANTYTGATSVNAGLLQVDGVAPATTTVANGATLLGAGTFTGVATNSGTLSPGASGSVGTMSFTSDLNLTSTAILSIDLDTLAASDKIVVAGKYTASALKLNATNLGGLNAGTYTLIDYATAGTIGAMTLGAMPGGFKYLLVNNTAGTSIDLVVTNAAPTAIALSKNSVAENLPAGTLVGALSATDSDPGATFTYSLVAGAGSTDNAAFTISGNQLLTAATFDFEARPSYSIRLRTTDNGGLSFEQAFTINITNVPEVMDRRIYYNNSAWDGNSAAANAVDDAAIAIDKQALLPGQTATFANYTSYSYGINGVMIDLAGLANAAALSATADFDFKIGNTADPATWAAAPAPADILVRAGAGTGGAHRIHLVWSNNAIQKQWLQVTVKATANTGLATPDVFYFGNAPGETGNSPANAAVDASDELLTRTNGSGLGTVGITSLYDFNRDKRVNSQDQLIARANRSGLSPLRLITAPVLTGAMAAATTTAPAPVVATTAGQTLLVAPTSSLFAVSTVSSSGLQEDPVWK